MASLVAIQDRFRLWSHVHLRFVILILSIFYVNCDGKQILKPRRCNNSETWYHHDHQYRYNYIADVETGIVGTSDITTGSQLNCDVILTVPRSCEALLELSGCELKVRDAVGQLQKSSKSEHLAGLLEKSVVYLQISKGRVTNHEIVVDKNEPVFITNIKRAIISQLQLYILSVEKYDFPVHQHDIFGVCPTYYTFNSASQNTIYTKRDVIRCHLPLMFGRDPYFFSLVKQFQLKHLKNPVEEIMFPFYSFVDCEYHVDDRHHIIRSHCVQQQAFVPFTFNGRWNATATFNISQTLDLVAIRKLPIGKLAFSRSLEGRKLVDLGMEYEKIQSKDGTSSTLLQQLTGLLSAAVVSSDTLPTEEFSKLVTLMRNSNEDILEDVRTSVFLCRETENCLWQNLKTDLRSQTLQRLCESFYTDALLSCGTDECVSVYTTSLQQNLIGFFQQELTLFNLALYYEPSSSVLQKIFTLCKNKSSSNCWLSFGTLVSRMASTLRITEDSNMKLEGQNTLWDIFQHMRATMGDLCLSSGLSNSSKTDQLETLLVTLKSLANAGDAIQEFYDDINDDDRDLIPAVLDCIKNPSLPFKISRAAILVLHKIKINRNVQTVLLEILGDVRRPASLRTSAFDLLMHFDDANNVQRVISAIRQEKLFTLQTYMLTRIGHLIESHSPDSKKIRTLWQEALNNETTPLPQFETIRGRTSRYLEFSEYIELPMNGLPLGAKLGISVIYDPASIIFGAFKIDFSLTVAETTYDILELGLDVQGFENIARMILGPDFSILDGIGASVAKIMDAAFTFKNSQTASPSFIHSNEKVVKTLRDLFQKVNLVFTSSIDAQLQIRFFGNEVGYVHLEDIIKVVLKSLASSDQKSAMVATLMQGIQFLLAKSLKTVELVRIMPTVAGLPWHIDIQSAFVAFSRMPVDGDFKDFFQRGEPFKMVGNLTNSFTLEYSAGSRFPIGDITDSGMRLNMSLVFNTFMSGRLKYLPEKAGNGSLIVEFGVAALKTPFSPVRFRSNVFLQQNFSTIQLETPQTQVIVHNCLPKGIEKWIGQRICLDGFYPKIVLSADTPMPLLSGPVHLDVNTTPVDSSLNEYTARLILDNRIPKDKSQNAIIIRTEFFAIGDELKRQLNMGLSLNTDAKGMQFYGSVPDLDLHYNFDFLRNVSKSVESETCRLSSIIVYGSKILHSVIIEFRSNQVEVAVVKPSDNKTVLLSVSDWVAKVNLSLPGLSLQVVADTSKNKVKPGNFHAGFAVRYFCEPNLGILYKLHLRPELAPLNGHVSEYVFKNDVRMSGMPFEANWSAEDTMYVLIPGHNITLFNIMNANATVAERDTVINWITEPGTQDEKLDVIHMEAQVHNQTVSRRLKFRYLMNVQYKNVHAIKLDGTLNGEPTNVTIDTDIVFSGANTKRSRRSLHDIYKRLQRIEQKVEHTFQTVEEFVKHQGSQWTEAFISWFMADSSASQRQHHLDKVSLLPSQSVETASWKSTIYPLLNRSSFTIKSNINLRTKPKLAKTSSQSIDSGFAWNLRIYSPDIKKDLLLSNGTFNYAKGLNLDTDWRLCSDIFNFSLDYFLQEQIEWPKMYHFQKWKLVDLTRHSFDRSLSFLWDLKRDDHFAYSLMLMSPNTNLSHAINFTMNSQLKAVRGSLDLHSHLYDIKYAESSNLTSKGLQTVIHLNSSWLDLDLNMNLDTSKPKFFLLKKHTDIFGKVPALNGSRKFDVDLRMDGRSIPSFLIAWTNGEGRVRNILGEILKKDMVLVTFSTKEPASKKNITNLKWQLELLEPTLIKQSLLWEPNITQTILDRVHLFMLASAHGLKVFGQLTAANIHKNISDMVVPFTDKTVSDTIDRIVQSHLKKVTLDDGNPGLSMPVFVKVLKGGLNIVQGLQTAWQNSMPGQWAQSLNLHHHVSTVILISTGFPSWLLNENPFFLRQFTKFTIIPYLHNLRATGKFSWMTPSPLVWKSFGSIPDLNMVIRQLLYQRSKWKSIAGVKSDLPFVAVISKDKIYTFDGTTFTQPVAKSRQAMCTYLLGTDFVIGNYSLLLTPDSVNIVTRSIGIDIDKEGGVSITDRDINQLPSLVAGENLFVNMNAGQVQVRIAHLMQLTYDVESQVYVIEISSQTHNRSLGLLGTATQEAGDDLMLPDGQIAVDIPTFLNDFELSSNKQCLQKAINNGKTSAVTCPLPQLEFCSRFFRAPSSPFVACFFLIDPWHFYEMCLHYACVESRPVSANACPIVQNYLKMCQNRNISIDTDDISKSCSTCERVAKGRRTKLDIVAGFALSQRGLFDVEPAKILGNLAGQLTSQDARFGLVLNGASGAYVHLFNGKLFVPAKTIEFAKRSELQSPSEAYSLEAIIHRAVTYPFRRDARHMLMLVVDDKAHELRDLDTIEKILHQLDISLILVSNLSHMKNKHLQVVTWNKQGMASKSVGKNDFTMPATSLGKLCTNTRGIWINLDTLAQGKQSVMKRLMKLFVNVVSQPSQRCAVKRL